MAAATDRSTAEDAVADTEHVNQVRLVGRLAAAPVRKELPSGDGLLSFRLIVSRTASPTVRSRSAGSRAPTVDTVDCAAWRKDLQRTAGRWRAGDVVEVHGALRRRFWRSPSGPASRTEVEVLRARRIAGG